jgi:hypothetical protein
MTTNLRLKSGTPAKSRRIDHRDADRLGSHSTGSTEPLPRSHPGFVPSGILCRFLEGEDAYRSVTPESRSLRILARSSPVKMRRLLATPFPRC